MISKIAAFDILNFENFPLLTSKMILQQNNMAAATVRFCTAMYYYC